MPKYILALDQGTSSSRAIAFEHSGTIAAQSQKEFRQIYPQQGWVEHDPEEIWLSQLQVMLDVIKKAGGEENIAAIGITNQRETSIIWNRHTGKPIGNAIVWQDRRTAGFCDELTSKKLDSTIQQKTGLVIDAYFSGTKVKWMLDSIPGARQQAEKGELAFGTVDSWLVWKLTGGKVHATDVSNASRTMLFNIHSLQWDDELLALMQVPRPILPEVKASSAMYGSTGIPEIKRSIPIAGVAGDQQAALFGQQCIRQGMVKNTYGTGCFIMLNTGSKPVGSKNRLLTTVGWKIGDETTYALEGSIFIGGAAVQWLRDGLGLIKKSSDIESLAAKVDDNGGVYFVPALTGLGAPYWDPYARGTITGLTRGTSPAHIARATLESIAYQTFDVLKAMEQDAGMPVSELRVDGGASANNLLMQFQSDVLQTAVARPAVLETTALGAAYLAGLATGFWKNLSDISQNWQLEKRFTPSKPQSEMNACLAKWKKAVERARKWEE